MSESFRSSLASERAGLPHAHVSPRAASRIVLITGHYYQSRRRAGFHFLADAFRRGGHDVVFFTASLSWLSRIGGDPRFHYPVLKERGRVTPVCDGLRSFVWFTPWHPAHLRNAILNWLARPLYRRYASLPLGAAEAVVANADVFIFECGAPLLLVERFRRLQPKARFVYRVSDDQRLLHHHPLMLETEARVAPMFDLISTPSQSLLQRFCHLPAATLHRHGVDKRLFDVARANPFADPNTINCVFVGNAYLDVDFVARASALFPTWRFHVIGPLRDLPRIPNVRAYGELPFQDTIPFIQHAAIGLTTLTYRFGAESFTDSLKTLQYTYCRLPIVAPAFLRSSRRNVFYYRPGDDDSIRRALLGAAAFDRSTVAREEVQSWDELASELLEADR